MTSILEFPKPRKIAPPLSAVSLPSSAIPDGPVIETTLHENMAVRKFLRFALDDIKFQLEMLSKERGLSPKRFQEAKSGALLLANYVHGLIESIDALIGQPIATAGPDNGDTG